MFTPKRVILSGMRPTGKLHLGNYFGALSNWVRLQNESDIQCFFMVADWHALTTDYENPQSIESNVQDMMIDWLAAGLDPHKSVIFRQSWVREHAELSLILSMITPLSWLERNPTYKDQIKELEGRDIKTHGFLGYPVLQAADILLYGTTHVPVGEDQLPHLELTREIARRFNFLYKETIFVEPQAILSHASKISGTDSRKMSKSYDNCVYLSDPEPAVKKKVHSMFTDPHKIKANDFGHPRSCPENPLGCAVFSLHEVLGEPPSDLKKREKDCREGALACSPCKAALTERLNLFLDPMRKSVQYEKEGSGKINQILRQGSAQASQWVRQRMEKVLGRIGFPVI